MNMIRKRQMAGVEKDVLEQAKFIAQIFGVAT